jgi:aspartyl-tRNA(Asn)/glutamyl-tRNA(Gln) amidotransferase subunit A
MKPTYDLISRHGVYPLSWSMDHVGFFTRTVEDAAIVLDVLSENRLSPSEKPHSRETHPRIGMLRDYFHEYSDEEAWTDFEKAVKQLKDAGAEIVETHLPKSFGFVHAAHRLIVASEAVSVHEENFKEKMFEYRNNIRGTIASGMLVPASSYIRAKRLRGRFIRETLTLLKNFDCILTPSASTPAPKGLEYTGDPAFNAPWSFCGFPAITLPSKITKEGLPLGIQLIDRPYNEANLIDVAKWCERMLCFPNEPKDPSV